MNLVVFGSGTGTNLEAILKITSVQAIVSDRECRVLEIGKCEGIPTIYHPYQQDRALHEEKIIQSLERLGCEIDWIFLAGYMRIIGKTLLQRYPNKIVNVHPADLTVLDNNGKRRYVGNNAVYQALMAGEKQTRSTVHIVTEQVDAGPILVLGPWVHYTEGEPITKEKANKHQEKQKKESDWPAVTTAIELMRKGALECVGSLG